MEEMLANAQTQANIEVNNNDILMLPELLLFYAVLVIRSCIKKVEGLKHQPLNPADINMDNTKTLTPDDLYTFIYWIISNKPAESTETTDKSQIRQNTPLHRQVLSLGQDLVYMSSSGKCRTPKHLGLGISLHQMTQSEAVVKLINRFGNCIGDDEVCRIDTCWSEEHINDNSSLLVNIAPGEITRAVADNFNRATESLGGIHHVVVNMVLYQLCSDSDVIGGFGTQ